MKYMGSKARIAKYILPIMLSKRKPDQYWVEPFVGGANIIDKVKGKRVGADINPYVISALLAIRDNIQELPKNNQEFTESDYQNLREDDSYKFKGYAGYAFSYGAKWLGGWRKSYQKNRDYVNEAYRNAVWQNKRIQGVKFLCCSYLDLELPCNSLIYCDPPYFNSESYKQDFDHKEFWSWCRKKADEGHTVFVSEYSAPDDFVCLWSKEMFNTLTQDTSYKSGIEKLFYYAGKNTNFYQINSSIFGN